VGPWTCLQTDIEAVPLRILLIDDDEDSRVVYKGMLEWAGFLVDIAADGMAGLRTARNDPPDVILLDLIMPGIDGGMVLQQLRAMPRTRAIPLIALTGVPEWLQDHAQQAARFDGVLIKPVESGLLIHEITRVVQKGGHAVVR
jgi:CheY-like chemotaxis protein